MLKAIMGRSPDVNRKLGKFEKTSETSEIKTKFLVGHLTQEFSLLHHKTKKRLDIRISIETLILLDFGSLT